MDNDTYVFHVTCVMHNTRMSERMKRYNVKTGIPVRLNSEQEIILAGIIREIILQKKYTILAFNICVDHIHLVIMCSFRKLTSIIQTIISIVKLTTITLTIM